jgi:glycosyltransferase involved in cell wall biosynthesis
MRIGFFGNTNNYPFMLAVALRRRGHDILFFVDQKDPLYRPECRYPDVNAEKPDWIVDVSPIRFRHYLIPNRSIARIVDLLRTCDAVVLNQYGPSLLPAINRPALALLTGSDLEMFANPNFATDFWSHLKGHKLTLRNVALFWMLRRLIRKQREGIQKSGIIRFFPRGVTEVGDRLLDDLGVSDRVKFFLPMTDIHAIAPAPPPMNDTPRIVSVARLNWKKPMRPGATQLDYKGTDIMIRGIVRFVRRSGRRVEIHLVRKGWDILETERLVTESGLQQYVVWHDEMSQSQLFDVVRNSDVVVEQLDQSLPGSGAVDALALGRPVITNWRKDVIPEYRRLPDSAICQASTDIEVCAQLERLLSDTSELCRVSRASRAAVEEHLSSDIAAAECETKLDALIGTSRA